MIAITDDASESNPLARQLRERYGEQLGDLLFRNSCLSEGPSGIVDGRTATDEECRIIPITLDASFCIDLTRDIPQQFADGLRFVIGNLQAEADRLEDDIASGKFPILT